jgi:hypothetical protein
MMKLVVISCWLIAGLASAQSPQTGDTVLAWRNEAGYINLRTNRWAALPYSLWTNCVFALAADIPAINAGSTNAVWLDWSPVRATATQTTLDSQPVRNSTAGAWAFNFDGIDDRIQLGTKSTGTNVTFFIRAKLNTIGKDVFRYGLLLLRSNGPTSVRVYPQSNAGTTFELGVNITNSIIDFVWTQSGTNAQFYVNGSLVAFGGTSQALVASGAPSQLGGADQFSTYTSGSIYSFKVFSRILSSNEVWRLSQ